MSMNCSRFRFLIQQRFDVALSQQDDRMVTQHVQSCELCDLFKHQIEQVADAALEVPLPEDCLPVSLEALAGKIMKEVPQEKPNLFTAIKNFFSGGGKKDKDKDPGKQSKQGGGFPHVSFKKGGGATDEDEPVGATAGSGKGGKNNKNLMAEDELLATSTRLKSLSKIQPQNEDVVPTGGSIGKAFGKDVPVRKAVQESADGELNLAESIRRSAKQAADKNDEPPALDSPFSGQTSGSWGGAPAGASGGWGQSQQEQSSSGDSWGAKAEASPGGWGAPPQTPGPAKDGWGAASGGWGAAAENNPPPPPGNDSWSGSASGSWGGAAASGGWGAPASEPPKPQPSGNAGWGAAGGSSGNNWGAEDKSAKPAADAGWGAPQTAPEVKNRPANDKDWGGGWGEPSGQSARPNAGWDASPQPAGDDWGGGWGQPAEEAPKAPGAQGWGDGGDSWGAPPAGLTTREESWTKPQTQGAPAQPPAEKGWGTPARDWGASAEADAGWGAPTPPAADGGWGKAEAAKGAPAGWGAPGPQSPTKPDSGWGNNAAPAADAGWGAPAPAADNGWGAPAKDEWGTASKQDQGWGEDDGWGGATAPGAKDQGWGEPAPKADEWGTPTPKADDGWGAATSAPAPQGWGNDEWGTKPASKGEDTTWGMPAKPQPPVADEWGVKAEDNWGAPAADNSWGKAAPKDEWGAKPADDGWGGVAADDGWGNAATAKQPAPFAADDWGATPAQPAIAQPAIPAKPVPPTPPVAPTTPPFAGLENKPMASASEPWSLPGSESEWGGQAEPTGWGMPAPSAGSDSWSEEGEQIQTGMWKAFSLEESGLGPASAKRGGGAPPPQPVAEDYEMSIQEKMAKQRAQQGAPTVPAPSAGPQVPPVPAAAADHFNVPVQQKQDPLADRLSGFEDAARPAGAPPAKPPMGPNALPGRGPAPGPVPGAGAPGGMRPPGVSPMGVPGTRPGAPPAGKPPIPGRPPMPGAAPQAQQPSDGGVMKKLNDKDIDVIFRKIGVKEGETTGGGRVNPGTETPEVEQAAPLVNRAAPPVPPTPGTPGMPGMPGTKPGMPGVPGTKPAMPGMAGMPPKPGMPGGPMAAKSGMPPVPPVPTPGGPGQPPVKPMSPPVPVAAKPPVKPAGGTGLFKEIDDAAVEKIFDKLTAKDGTPPPPKPSGPPVPPPVPPAGPSKAPKINVREAVQSIRSVAAESGAMPPPPKIAGIGRLDTKVDAQQDQPSGKISSIGKFLLDQQDQQQLGKLSQQELADGRFRVLTIEAAEEIYKLLNHIAAQPGVVGSCIVGHDGIPIANNLPQEYDPESVGAWSLGVYVNTTNVIKRMAHNHLHQLVAKTHYGYLIIADFGGGILITVSSGQQTEHLIPLMRSITQLVAQ